MPDSINLKIDKVAMQTTFVCSTVLMLKMVVANMQIAYAKAKTGSRPPEDEKIMAKFGKQNFTGTEKAEVSAEDKEMEQRCIRIGANDLENIPIALILCWASLLVCQSPEAHMYLTIVFTVGRILHHMFYYCGKQPHRMLAFELSISSMIGFTVNGMRGVFNI